MELTKVVVRPVYDSIVKERVQGDNNAYADYFTQVDTYQNNVTVTLPRVELSRSCGGLVRKGAECTFKVILQQLMNCADSKLPCELQWHISEEKVNSYPTDLKMIKVLKALAIAQLSMSQEFADVMGYMFKQITMTVIRHKKLSDCKSDINFTEMQEVVFNSTLQYIIRFVNE